MRKNMYSIISQIWIPLIFFGENKVVFATCFKPQLELLVTPPDSLHKGNNVRIHWRFNRTYDGCWIGLYSDVPKKSDQFLLGKKIQVTELINTVTITDYSVVTDAKTLKYDKPTYLGFTAVAWTVKDGKDEAIVITKLQTYPQWMKHYWKFIKDVPMTDLFLPGTHDTSSYRGDPPDKDSDSFTADAWSLLKKMPLLNNWSLTQNRTIKEQLVSGIRYLDIRVKRDGNIYWACHAKILMHTLNQVLQQVVEFVMSTEKEIVIFDIHELVKGIKSDDEHETFVSYLKQSFTIRNKRLYVSPNKVNLLWKATPEMILAEGRIIISYINPDFQKKNNMDALWPTVFQYWGNKQHINDLKGYIYATIPTRKARNDSLNTLTSVMAELTGNYKRIKNDTNDDISAQAAEDSSQIQTWFLDPVVALETNVLAVDFFTVSGVVRLAYIWNERKYFNSSCDAQETISDDYYQQVLIP